MPNAVSLIADTTIPEQLQMTQWAGLSEMLEVFNASSAGAIRLTSTPAMLATKPGSHYETLRYKTISNLDNRANVATDGDIDTLKLETNSGASVLQTRSLGPVEVSDDFSDRSLGSNATVASNLGNQFAQAQLQALRNNVIAIAAAAGTTAYSAAHYTDNTPGSATGARVPFTAAIAEAMMQDMADARQNMKLWVMPSLIFSNLITANLAFTALDTVAGSILNDGQRYQFMGLPILVVDAPVLIGSTPTSSYYTRYGVLLLGDNAVSADIVSEKPVETDRNIVANSPTTIVRGQYTVNYNSTGAKFRIAVGATGINPTDAVLITAANWITDGDDHREFPLVYNLVNSIA